MKRIKPHNAAKIFLITLIIIGFIFGIIYFQIQNDMNKTNIINKISTMSNIIDTKHQNIILNHLLVITIMIILAYTIIGVPIILFYLFYRSASIGFFIASFYNVYHIKGVIFVSIFTIISQVLFISILLYISYISLKISKRMIKVIIFKESDSLYQTIKGLFSKLAILIFIIFLYDLFLYFFANNIIKIFFFLIK